MMKHVYPPPYGPKHRDPFVRIAWAILDKLPPDALPDEVRFLVGGMLAGSLSIAHEFGKNQKTPSELAKKYKR